MTYDLPNGVVVNDLERPKTEISRSRQYLTLNISQTGRYNDTVTTKY